MQRYIAGKLLIQTSQKFQKLPIAMPSEALTDHFALGAKLEYRNHEPNGSAKTVEIKGGHPLLAQGSSRCGSKMEVGTRPQRNPGAD
jgi:hypothetical protein